MTPEMVLALGLYAAFVLAMYKQQKINHMLLDAIDKHEARVDSILEAIKVAAGIMDAGVVPPEPEPIGDGRTYEPCVLPSPTPTDLGAGDGDTTKLGGVEVPFDLASRRSGASGSGGTA